MGNIVFTDQFTAKNSLLATDRIAGTDGGTGNPIRTQFQQILKSTCEVLNTYFYLGVATPTTNPPLFAGLQVGTMAFYLASQNGTYENFRKNIQNEKIVIQNEIAVLQSIWVLDPGTDSTVLRWEKKSLGGIVDVFSAFEDFTAQLMNMAIGVISATHINPLPQDESESYVKWEDNKWSWYFTDIVTGIKSGVFLPLGKKVEIDGVYYVLGGNGTYKREYVELLENNIGVVSADYINETNPSNNNLPIIIAVDEGIIPGYKVWKYYPYGFNGNVLYTLHVGTRVKIKPSQGSNEAKYYILGSNGIATEDIGSRNGITRLMSNIQNIQDRDSLFGKVDDIRIDDVKTSIQNKNIHRITIFCDDCYVESQFHQFDYSHFNGTIEVFLTDDGDYWIHMFGNDGTFNISKFHVY